MAPFPIGYLWASYVTLLLSFPPPSPSHSVSQEYGMLHEFVSHPCAEAMLIFLYPSNFSMCAAEANAAYPFPLSLSFGGAEGEEERGERRES